MRTATRTSRVSLREFFPHSHIYGSQDIRVSSCCDDARSCRPGDLYVALETAAADGHESAAEALRRGAKAVLAERLLPIEAPVCVVPDSREAYGRLCQHLAGDPSGRMRTVGNHGHQRQNDDGLAPGLHFPHRGRAQRLDQFPGPQRWPGT